MGSERHPKQYVSQHPQFSAGERASLESGFLSRSVWLKESYEFLSARDFYRDFFPVGSFEQSGHPGDGQERKPNGIISVLDPTHKGRSYNRILFDDFEMLDVVHGEQFAILAPVSYCGRRRLSSNAFYVYGFCIDLDDVTVQTMQDLFFQMENEVVPWATHIVNSGTGLHVYYRFETPIPIYGDIKRKQSLGRLKHALTDLVWNQYTSTSKNKQFQGIFQGYRVVGTQTKLGPDFLVEGYRIGNSPVTLAYLNEFVSRENQANFDDIKYVTRAEAKEKWPEWYQRRIVEQRSVGEYELDDIQKQRRRAWYDAWKKKIKKGAVDGNRYYCVGVLFNYAMKAEISIDEARKDAVDLLPYLNGLTRKEGNEFTLKDIEDAEKFYDKKYIRMGRQMIFEYTKIDIGKTKRNPRGKRLPRKPDKNGNCNVKVRATAVRDALHPDGSWRNKSGRPKGSGTKEHIVQEYFKLHPMATPTEAARSLGISRPTVYKYMNKSTEEDGTDNEKHF